MKFSLCYLSLFIMINAFCRNGGVAFATNTEAEGSARIKDIAEMRGVRSNQLMGVGLVVGLPGTGDSKQSLLTNKALSNMLTRLGTNLKPTEVLTRNVAAVLVTADLPPFARVGDKLNIRISSLGDSVNLEGGSLVLTALSAADSQVYAVAQGAFSLGSGMAGNAGGGLAKSTAPKTVALAQGATVEREFEQSFIRNGAVELSLKNADFTTATRLAKSVNEFFGEFLADPVNAGLVTIRVPKSARGGPSFTPVAFVAALEQIQVETDTRAIVVVNERTGTVISGSKVIVSPVAISHGNLEIIVEKKINMVGELPLSTTVGELVRALNQLGAGPRDLVAILQALDAAKALKADLKFM